MKMLGFVVLCVLCKLFCIAIRIIIWEEQKNIKVGVEKSMKRQKSDPHCIWLVHRRILEESRKFHETMHVVKSIEKSASLSR